MTTYTLLKKLLGVKDIVVEGYRLEELPGGVLKLVIRVRPTAAKQCRCSKCGRRIPRYDRPEHLRTWRALDFGGILIELEGYAPVAPVRNTVSSRWMCPGHFRTRDLPKTLTEQLPGSPEP